MKNSNTNCCTFNNKNVDEINHNQHIKHLINIATSLSSEKKINKLFDLILDEALNYTCSDGATIYTVSPDKKCLKFALIYNKSMNLYIGGSKGKINWPSIPLYDEMNNKHLEHMAAYVAHKKQSISFDDVYFQNKFDASGTKKFDKMNNYRTKSVAAVPLINHEDEVIGVIQLINSTNCEGTIVAFSKQRLQMLEALASLAAITLTNKKLVISLENLLHQFTESIAKAIDQKSLHTSGHLTRVAKLSMLIGKNLGKSKNYKELNAEEKQELSMAAWMHDIGKIITPQHILEKAKKLQTITDRIENVEIRFSLIRSFIEIDTLTKKLDSESSQKLLNMLDEDLAFIKKVNFGAEYTDEDDILRLHRIFDFNYKHKGVVHKLLTENELKNLAIRRGTLLPEEIIAIRKHASVTKSMLESLHFPKKLQNVPLYASAHHEKLNGKGYPEHLQAKDIPVQARIIALADIFEALTASDRPYKKGKTLSQALKILAFCAKDNEIDPDLLDLFIDEKIYLQYAEKHMPNTLIDEVDIKKIKETYR